MSYLISIPNAIHVCPQCEQDVASGFHSVTGKPRICSLCVVENIREQEAVRNAAASTPRQPIADKAVIYALIFGFGLMVGMFVGKFLLQVSGVGNS